MQDRRAPLDVFVGRAAELAQVSEVVSRVAAGQPWLVTIEGDPGVGKTALARRCLTGESGLRVLSVRAGQAETDLDFGLVDQLLRAAGGAARPELPADEADSAASSFAVGAHLLEVLGEQQARAAVVVLLVDDLQWADRRSVEALTFMLRRLSVDPVVAVVVYRGPRDRLDETAQRLGAAWRTAADRLGGLGPDRWRRWRLRWPKQRGDRRRPLRLYRRGEEGTRRPAPGAERRVLAVRTDVRRTGNWKAAVQRGCASGPAAGTRAPSPEARGTRLAASTENRSIEIRAERAAAGQ